MTQLIKSINTTLVPGVAGSPGSPGSPAVPARTEWVTTYGRWVLQYMPYGSSAAYVSEYDIARGAAPAGHSWVWVPGGQSSTLTSYPGTPAVAPIPAVPSTPARFVKDFNLGWTGRASSIAYMPGDGFFEFRIPASNVGTVVGLSSAPQRNGYSDIQFGFYAARGGAEIYEYGVSVVSLAGYSSEDDFKIRRINKTVEYLVNGDVVHTSAMSSDLSMFLTAALYSGGDSIVGAFIGAVASGYAEMEPMEANAGEDAYTAANGAAHLLPLQSVAHSLFTRGSAKLVALSASGGNRYASGTGQMVAATGDASGFETLPYALANGIGQFMIGYGHSLTGSVGSSEAVMGALTSFAADEPSASAGGSLRPLAGYAFTYELPTDATVFSVAAARNLLSPDVSLFVVMNSSGVMTGLVTAQLLVDGLANSVAIMSGEVTPQLTIEAVMLALASAKNLNFDDGASTVWALNTKNSGTTRYENYGFNSFAKIGKDYYGVKVDGLYKLSGASDAGAQIAAAVNLGKSDFGTSRLKSLTQCYVGVASTGAVVLKVIADGQTYIYTARASSTNLETQRIDLGRGFRSNYFELELQNTAGGAFDLASIEFTPIPLSRRI